MTATYLTLDDIRGPTGVLDQFTTEGGNANQRDDGLLQSCLDDAQAIIDGELGFTLAAAASGTQVVYGDGTQFLTPPPFAPGSVTDVTTLDGYAVPDYAVRDGALVVTTTDGILATPPTMYNAWNPFTTSYGVWAAGVPYTVTASYGAAVADLLVARRITLELAVQLFKFRDAGGSTVVGTEAAVITVKNALSPVVKGALERLKQKYAPSVGVW